MFHSDLGSSDCRSGVFFRMVAPTPAAPEMAASPEIRAGPPAFGFFVFSGLSSCLLTIRTLSRASVFVAEVCQARAARASTSNSSTLGPRYARRWTLYNPAFRSGVLYLAHMTDCGRPGPSCAIMGDRAPGSSNVGAGRVLYGVRRLRSRPDAQRQIHARRWLQ